MTGYPGHRVGEDALDAIGPTLGLPDDRVDATGLDDNLCANPNLFGVVPDPGPLALAALGLLAGATSRRRQA